MREDTTILFTNPAFWDKLSELVRESAQKIIRQAVEAKLGVFLEEHSAERDWVGEEFVYLWADGIYVNVRSEEWHPLLIVGCDARGRKHFLALEAGFRDYVEFMVMLSSFSSSLFLGGLRVANST